MGDFAMSIILVNLGTRNRSVSGDVLHKHLDTRHGIADMLRKTP